MTYPRLVTVAIIEKGHKILLIKRNSKPCAGKWAFPSGTGAFKKYSDPREAVKGEVLCDLNVDFVPNKLLGVYYDNNQFPTLSIAYIGNIKGEININPKTTLEHKLVAKIELLNIKLAFNQTLMATDYLKNLK